MMSFISSLHRKPEILSSCLEVNEVKPDFRDVSSNIEKQDDSDREIMARDMV
jgi:hypothetical protein